MVANERVSSLREAFQHESRFVVELNAPPNGVVSRLAALEGLSSAESVNGSDDGSYLVRFVLDDPAVRMGSVLNVLAADGAGIIQVRRVEANLGDVVAALSGRTDQ
jgi:hypothetical protein